MYRLANLMYCFYLYHRCCHPCLSRSLFAAPVLSLSLSIYPYQCGLQTLPITHLLIYSHLASSQPLSLPIQRLRSYLFQHNKPSNGVLLLFLDAADASVCSLSRFPPCCATSLDSWGRVSSHSFDTRSNLLSHRSPIDSVSQLLHPQRRRRHGNGSREQSIDRSSNNSSTSDPCHQAMRPRRPTPTCFVSESMTRSTASPVEWDTTRVPSWCIESRDLEHSISLAFSCPSHVVRRPRRIDSSRSMNQNATHRSSLVLLLSANSTIQPQASISIPYVLIVDDAAAASMSARTNPISSNRAYQGLLLFFPGPASFTGEDVLEIHGHGGRATVNRMLSTLQSLSNNGDIRLAEPGEFSRRYTSTATAIVLSRFKQVELRLY